MKKKSLPIAAFTLAGILTIGAAAAGIKTISAQTITLTLRERQRAFTTVGGRPG